MTDCTTNCTTCAKDCDRRIEKWPCNPGSSIRHVVGVSSGKGGVGKSTIAALLASAWAKQGRRVGLMDADLTGPCASHLFGVQQTIVGDEHGMAPARTALGVALMSINLLLDDPTAPVVWRGPVLSGVLRQLWSETHWGELDMLVVDLPPGTGDMPLSVFQSMPLSGVVVVTTPQSMVQAVVGKAFRMAQMLNVPVLGLLENLSGFVCPGCKELCYPMGDSRLDVQCAAWDVPALGRLPQDPQMAAVADAGLVETIEAAAITAAAGHLWKGLQP